MRFKVGDHVSHSSHGSGQIVAIEERRLSGSEAKLYYAVATDKCTVWVPVDADSPSSLRSPVSRQELAHYRTLLKSRPTPLDPDRRQRSLEVTNRLRLGSFQSM